MDNLMEVVEVVEVVMVLRKGNFGSLIWRYFTAWHRRRLSGRLVWFGGVGWHC